MRILIAPDSFKGSLKSTAAAEAMARGVRKAAPDADIVVLPVGDGGEGTLESLVVATKGEFETHLVIGPLGEPVEARLGLLGDGRTVFLEIAEASGLSRIAPHQRDPLVATTYGTGQLLRAALQTGRSRVLIGIGGSATNDAGAGLLQALGARLSDPAGVSLPQGGAALVDLDDIDISRMLRPDAVELTVACDVTNPLTGPDGASAIYGPQKGASDADVRRLDAALTHFARVASTILGRDDSTIPGAGAAGGLGFALVAFLGARLERGVELVLDAVGFDAALDGVDLVLTGEGRIDGQTTRFGKTLAGIGARARAHSVPVIGIAGALAPDVGDYRAGGLDALFSIIPRPMTQDEAMHRAPELLSDAARRVMEIFLAGRLSATPTDR